MSMARTRQRVWSLALVALVAWCVIADAAITTDNISNGSTKTCRALALSGGGDKGAYEAGAIYGLVNNLPPEDTQWDVVTGISAGSLNAGATALFSVGDEVAMAQYLWDTWGNITKSDVYEDWSGGVLAGVLAHSGIFNTAPLRSFVTKQFARGLKDRRVVIGATSLTTGELYTWTEADEEELIEAVMASSSIPGVFPATKTRNQTFVDGGVKLGVNIYDAVTRCMEIVDDPSDIILDVLLCQGSSIHPVDASRDKTITVLMRSLGILRYNMAMKQTQYAKDAYPMINWRYVLYPSTTLPGLTDLDFNHDDLMTILKVGEQDAVNAIKQEKGWLPVQTGAVELDRA